MREHVIPACQGRAIDVARGQLLSVTDVEGGQVVDFLRRALRIRTSSSPRG